jgi:hypothetical protein
VFLVARIKIMPLLICETPDDEQDKLAINISQKAADTAPVFGWVIGNKMDEI